MSTQSLVQATMKSVGGYWRPLAAAVRLLEEVGEVAEALANGADVGLGEELSDLWIITTAMADQFIGNVAEPGTAAGSELDGGSDFASLAAAAGQIGRIINYYDGPKTPRSLDGWISLDEAVARFHVHLELFASRHGVDLKTSVQRKLEQTPARDADRFVAGYDSRTAPVLERLVVAQEQTPCVFAKRARLLGAPDWDGLSTRANVDRIVPSLLQFTKAALPEQLDGFVVGGPEFTTMELLAQWFLEVLSAVEERDPTGAACLAGGVDRPGWQFEFNGQRMFVAVFARAYDYRHPRYSPGETFILLQPEEAFSRRGVGAGQAGSDRIKASIRRRFAVSGMPYTRDDEPRLEARLYLPARFDGDVANEWWTRALPK